MAEDNCVLQRRREIVSQLTRARLEKGLSQARLAELVGTQRSNISRIENGGQNLSLDLLIKIANALGKDVSVTLQEGCKFNIYWLWAHLPYHTRVIILDD